MPDIQQRLNDMNRQHSKWVLQPLFPDGAEIDDDEEEDEEVFVEGVSGHVSANGRRYQPKQGMVAAETDSADAEFEVAAAAGASDASLAATLGGAIDAEAYPQPWGGL